MRDIQLQSGKSLTITFDLPTKVLLCTCCANDCAKALADLHNVRVDVFPVAMLCGAFRCERCNLRTGLLYEVREV